jgi:hypothetical protein
MIIVYPFTILALFLIRMTHFNACSNEWQFSYLSGINNNLTQVANGELTCRQVCPIFHANLVICNGEVKLFPLHVLVKIFLSQ